MHSRTLNVVQTLAAAVRQRPGTDAQLRCSALGTEPQLFSEGVVEPMAHDIAFFAILG